MGGFLYTMIVLRGGFLLPSSRVPGGGGGGGGGRMVMNEIDTHIILLDTCHLCVACSLKNKN